MHSARNGRVGACIRARPCVRRTTRRSSAVHLREQSGYCFGALWESMSATIVAMRRTSPSDNWAGAVAGVCAGAGTGLPLAPSLCAGELPNGGTLVCAGVPASPLADRTLNGFSGAGAGVGLAGGVGAATTGVSAYAAGV